MKVIDILNKIANREDIPVIKWYGKTLIWNSEHKWFNDIDDRAYCKNDFDFEDLNDEVEIIEEEKEIEKIVICPEEDGYLVDKINEIIDEIKKLKEK